MNCSNCGEKMKKLFSSVYCNCREEKQIETNITFWLTNLPLKGMKFTNNFGFIIIIDVDSYRVYFDTDVHKDLCVTKIEWFDWINKFKESIKIEHVN